MLLIITIILSSLIAINFLLLIFSCNKCTKRPIAKIENTITYSVQKQTVISTETVQLAPTGS